MLSHQLQQNVRVVEFGFYFKILNMVERKKTAAFPAIIDKMIELEFRISLIAR